MMETIEVVKLAVNLLAIPLITILWGLNSRVAAVEAKIDMMITGVKK